MPIYEYKCNDCEKKFEKLVFSEEKIECPECKKTNITKLFSTFASIVAKQESVPPCSNGVCPKGGCPTGSCTYQSD